MKFFFWDHLLGREVSHTLRIIEIAMFWVPSLSFYFFLSLYFSVSEREIEIKRGERERERMEVLQPG